MLIQKNARGYIIRRTHRKHGQFYYFTGIKDGQPVFMSDHTHAKAYSTEAAARKKAEELKQ